MNHSETVEEFYERVNMPAGGIFSKRHGHFNVYNRNFCKSSIPYSRRDFYKISLINGRGILYFADKGIEINGPSLVFSNPMIPSSWEALSRAQGGYFCLFTEDFIKTHDKNNPFYESPLYKPGGSPVFFVNSEQEKFITEIFEKMQQEMVSEYLYKDELLYNYVNILIHEALKMQPADTYFKHANASSRIVSLFTELLERQFPIDSPEEPLRLKSAADFATQLAVHVNHLNRSLKDVTGKTTSEHIAERIVREAKALLLHTNWNISEIAYALGFEYPSYFNNFFRRQTNSTPKGFRA